MKKCKIATATVTRKLPPAAKSRPFINNSGDDDSFDDV
jgi:hypothetical protein